MSVLLKKKQFQPNTNKKTYFSVFACRSTPNAAQRLTLGPGLRSRSGILDYVLQNVLQICMGFDLELD